MSAAITLLRSMFLRLLQVDSCSDVVLYSAVSFGISFKIQESVYPRAFTRPGTDADSQDKEENVNEEVNVSLASHSNFLFHLKQCSVHLKCLAGART